MGDRPVNADPVAQHSVQAKQADGKDYLESTHARTALKQRTYIMGKTLKNTSTQ